MSYTTYDFAESLKAAGIATADVARVVAAWGHGSGQGEDSGRGWSEDGVTDWCGGFLMRLNDGRIAYLTGWCDYTGWGCQDGADVEYFDQAPPINALGQDEDNYNRPAPEWWDEEPADLNLWLEKGAPDEAYL